MAANDCWGAFGSDSDDDDDGSVNSGNTNGSQNQQHNPFEQVADTVSLSITQYFVSLTKSTGVLLQERVVGIGQCSSDNGDYAIMTERVSGRGMKVLKQSELQGSQVYQCDAAILWNKDVDNTDCSHIKQSLIPGGVLWLVFETEEHDNDDAKAQLSDYPDSIWDINFNSVQNINTSSHIKVISIQKRACVVNSWSCPWMNKQQRILAELPTLNINDEFDSENETYLQYERKVATALTISPSIAERTREKISVSSTSLEESIYSTILTEANVQRAVEVFERHGLVVIKGLLPHTQTTKWGEAVLADFNSAVDRLKSHPTRPVDLMNPQKEGTFEPLSYKELAMREDLRVDLRSGPEMDSLRSSENATAQQMMDIPTTDNNDGPTMINADIKGTASSWRYHPSILSIIKATFNPKDDELSKGNFGRWNFGGSGPDGTPQPFRLGQIGSVLSCPGSADQAIHADTPHLFEHVDCLPCHYLNVFTPGYKVSNSTNTSFRNEFHNGIWTGNSTIGGTAFVHGSHRLSVTAQLLSEENETEGDNALTRKQLLQLRTLRPALDTGDVVFFDCRTIHYGLANASQGDKTGEDVNAGKRPMLYLNVSQSWFYDPKNWDDREKIFS